MRRLLDVLLLVAVVIGLLVLLAAMFALMALAVVRRVE